MYVQNFIICFIFEYYIRISAFVSLFPSCHATCIDIGRTRNYAIHRLDILVMLHVLFQKRRYFIILPCAQPRPRDSRRGRERLLKLSMDIYEAYLKSTINLQPQTRTIVIFIIGCIISSVCLKDNAFHESTFCYKTENFFFENNFLQVKIVLCTNCYQQRNFNCFKKGNLIYL